MINEYRGVIRSLLKTFFSFGWLGICVYSLLFFILIPFAVSEMIGRNPYIDEFFLVRTAFVQFHLKNIEPQFVTPFTFLVGGLLSAIDSFEKTVIVPLFC